MGTGENLCSAFEIGTTYRTNPTRCDYEYCIIIQEYQTKTIFSIIPLNVFRVDSYMRIYESYYSGVRRGFSYNCYDGYSQH